MHLTKGGILKPAIFILTFNAKNTCAAQITICVEGNQRSHFHLIKSNLNFYFISLRKILIKKVSKIKLCKFEWSVSKIKCQFVKVRSGFESNRKVARSSEKFPKGYERSQKVPKDSEKFRNIHKGSVWKLPKSSKKFR